MADALLSALAIAILKNLKSLVYGEFAIADRLTTELNNLENTFTTIQAVLHDAEEKQWKDEAIKNWLRKLKHAAYEADDLLDEFAIHAQRRRLQRNLRRRVRVRSFFSLENPVVYRLKMAHKLKSVGETLDAIASEKNKFHLREVVIEDRGVGILDWRLTTSLVNEKEVIGRKKEKEELITMLLTNSEDISVHAICGMGGLGKTTLTQLVYNDERVERHFDLRIWVCVSDEFDLRRLIRDIIESIEGSTPNIQELDTLQRKLQQKLRERKFLLVLDDVWNEECDKWNRLYNAVRCGGSGSVVIVTTRNEKIALIMARNHIHCIRRLSDVDSWTLFEQLAFDSGSQEKLVNLETIGRDIVKKCGGLPLAIKVIGSLMRLKRKESEWLSIKESEIWELPYEGSMNILPALRLSYNHLAPHMKQCFAFCSLFPKDYEIEKEKLIGLWMANGFIPCKGQLDLHDMGQEIFDELVWRSLFQDVGEDYWGNTTCKMHDIVHDLAQSIMKDECKLIEPNNIFEVSKMFRHLSFYKKHSDQSFPRSNIFKDQSLRSFLWLGKGSLDQQVASYYLSGQKHLRVLDLSKSNLEKLPMSIERFKHLRFLDFSDSRIISLPESTTTLQNLQTLNLRRCWVLYKLPDGMKHMKSLMHLEIIDCTSLSYMPAEMGKLSHLKKLSKFIVGKDNGRGIGELKELNLREELSIEKLECVKSYGDAKNANLMQKKDLKSLHLSWSWSPEEEEEEEEEDENSKSDRNYKEEEEVLDGLQPHSNLKKLIIRNYKGSKFPNWMMELILPNLVEIELLDCDRCEHIPPFGKLKFLKVLKLGRMSGVKCIGNDIYGNGESPFPSLEILSLENMVGVEEWEMLGGTSRKDLFPVLESLSLHHCPKLNSLSESIGCLTALRTLTIRDSGLSSLPNQIGNLTSLSRLEIRNCPNLMSLPKQIGNLMSLSRLVIRSCPNLMCLPDEIRDLEMLSELRISDCPDIKRRCEKEDRPKIAHIPLIRIYNTR